jgi:CheY-like chemotaxis protein
VNWDITEVKEGELARQQAAVAERASQAKSQFLSRMSHELRTPLNAVLGFSQLLQMQAQAAGDVDQAGKLGHIHAAGSHLLQLIDGVLDLSSMESGELPLTCVAVDVAALVRQAMPLVTPLAQQHGVRLRSDTLVGMALADATRLMQVLVNLLSNAIKYGHAGGEVIVEVQAEDAVVVITVKDNGRGMGPEQLNHLFEPFNRLGAERSGIEGTGIGLTIVKALVEGMGGAIEVRSRLGSGTSVRVSLPNASTRPMNLAPASPTPSVQVSASPRADLQTTPAPRTGRLLYIEDNSVNVTLVEALVHTLPGLTIASEPNGAAGVSRARSWRPDLVLVDMQLPDFDGFEVLRRMRSEQETSGIPCIALSANAMPEDVERALAAGFADYWTKPIDFKHFLRAIEERFPAGAAVPH